MTTKKQIDANRRNAKKSTGPRTAKGKKITALNSCKHRILSLTILDAEDEAYRKYLDELTAEYEPVGIMEEECIHRIALNLVRKDRLYTAEWGMIMKEKQRAALATVRDRALLASANKIDPDALMMDLEVIAINLETDPPKAVQQLARFIEEYDDGITQSIPGDYLRWVKESRELIESDPGKLVEKATEIYAKAQTHFDRLFQLFEIEREPHERVRAAMSEIPEPRNTELLMRYERYLESTIDRAFDRLFRLQDRREKRRTA